MIGVVIITHGNIAQALLDTMVHVVGTQENIIALGMEQEDDTEVFKKTVHDAVSTVNTGRGAILLTDMFGGTPSNVAIASLNVGVTEVIAGVNVPMLVKLAQIRNDPQKSLKDIVLEVQAAGQKYIHVASDFV
ncbi:MAG: PTS fructose transporter subunit IIA [Cyanobacteria bacterium J06649_11]